MLYIQKIDNGQKQNENQSIRFSTLFHILMENHRTYFIKTDKNSCYIVFILCNRSSFNLLFLRKYFNVKLFVMIFDRAQTVNYSNINGIVIIKCM
jgi:hypothetical protein